MVKGLIQFKEYFKNFQDNYILIGGTACDFWLNQSGLNFRVTKDLDIIIVVEALNAEFVKQFWSFIKEGKYLNKQKSTGEKCYYRFSKPENNDLPEMIELFSRKIDILEIPENQHLTPIPIDDDLSSLSAILMDDDYYSLALSESRSIDNLSLLSVNALICLKAKAFLDLNERKSNDLHVDTRDIIKHKNDVFRLTMSSTEADILRIPSSIHDDMSAFLNISISEPPDWSVIAKNVGINKINGNEIIDLLKNKFFK